MRSARGGGAAGPQNFDQSSIMMKSLYDQQQQQQQLLAAQQSLQGLLSPGSNSSCSSTTQPSNNVSSNNYPLAMDCDPPLASQQMPPPPPPIQLHQQSQRFGIDRPSLQGGGVSSTTSGSTNSLNSSRIRQNSGSSAGSFNHLQNKNQHAPTAAASSANVLSGGGTGAAGMLHHHNYAPASLPLDLVHHPLSAAASHLMMTDSSVITASTAGSSAGPASYSSWPTVAPPNHVFGMPPPPLPSHMLASMSATNQMDQMANAPATAHLQQQHLMQHQPQTHQLLQHSQRLAGGGAGGGIGSGLPPVTSNSNSNSNVGNNNNSGSGSGDASSPMVGVCVQQSPVVIH